jgi:hypothetical protein
VGAQSAVTPSGSSGATIVVMSNGLSDVDLTEIEVRVKAL